MIDDVDYRLARAEHAFLLRAEGVYYKDIAGRLGFTICRARQLVMWFGRKKLQRAMRHTKVGVT